MDMRVAVLTSDALRHRYFVQQVGKSFEVVQVLHQSKKNYYTGVRQSSHAIERHFANLTAAELAEFSPRLKDHQTPLRVVEDINAQQHVDEALKCSVDAILLFGTQILKSQWLDAFPTRIINLHLGLSPFYRGSATLFWPCANGELECLGATIHVAVQEVDAGDILRQIKIPALEGDSYYTLSTRLIRHAIDCVPDVTREYLEGHLKPVAQGKEGQVFRKRDFDDAALKRMLDYFGDGLTEAQIKAAIVSDKCHCSQ